MFNSTSEESSRWFDLDRLLNDTACRALHFRAESESTNTTAIELAPDDPYSHYYRALVALRANDRDTAMTAINTAAELGYSRVMLAAEPYLEPLKTREEYVALIANKRGEQQ